MNTSQVSIGKYTIGGDKAVLLQSMTSTPTLNTNATVEQIIRIVDAGAQFVRITAQNTKEAHHLSVIKNELRKRFIDIPLIADIHFNPKAAEIAATIVDKIRINPGNYIDTKKGKANWSTQEYEDDVAVINRNLSGLIQICKKHKTVIRIGVNHGSLSERIKWKYGNTARGMMESAMEFIHAFQELNFHHIVISLKANNVLVMVDANKMLYQRMLKENCIFPIHLGVTEAGDGEDARIKSAIGIGTLLAENIGDTIRVSLTEEPEIEIPVAQKIVIAAKENQLLANKERKDFERRNSYKINEIGDKQIPIVIQTSVDNHHENRKADYIFHPQKKILIRTKDEKHIHECSSNDIITKILDDSKTYFVKLIPGRLSTELLKALKEQQNIIIVLTNEQKSSIAEMSILIEELNDSNILSPIILHLHNDKKDFEDLMIHSSVQAASFLLNGQIDGLWIESSYFESTKVSFGILQATKARISKTDYIACPSCGRTLFNIQEKLQEIKKQTQQYKGLKIGIMGCIVNGPGEMADADYGYVGAKKGHVNIYKGQNIVKKNVSEEEATLALLQIIKQDIADKEF